MLNNTLEFHTIFFLNTAFNIGGLFTKSSSAGSQHSIDWCVCMYACSVMSDSAIPRAVAHHAPLSMEFSRQEYWSELPFPTPGDLPNPGIKSMSPASPVLAGRFFTTVSPGKPNID